MAALPFSLQAWPRARLLTPVADEVKSGWAARWGVFGDVPTRFVLTALKVTPWFLEPVLIGGWAFLVFLIAKSHRNAIAANLRALHPSWSAARATLGAWQVFWNFSLTFIDALRCQTGTGAIDWAVDGLKELEDLAGRSEGCIILTAHMGNYDLAAPVFASRFQRTLYAVRAPERVAETRKLREEEFRRTEEENPLFRTLYNEDGSLLGIELARLLQEGNVVAVQGDRVLFDVSPMLVEVEPGLTMKLPKGPLFLARATGAPCFPLFIVRDGWRRYRVVVFPPLELPPRKRGGDDEAAALWADAILRVVRVHWRQWYVFELLLTRGPSRSD